MLTEIEFKCLKRLASTEMKLIREYEELYRGAREPQLKSDLQSVVASHNNHLICLTKFMEDNI